MPVWPRPQRSYVLVYQIGYFYKSIKIEIFLRIFKTICVYSEFSILLMIYTNIYIYAGSALFSRVLKGKILMSIILLRFK